MGPSCSKRSTPRSPTSNETTAQAPPVAPPNPTAIADQIRARARRDRDAPKRDCSPTDNSARNAMTEATLSTCHHLPRPSDAAAGRQPRTARLGAADRDADGGNRRRDERRSSCGSRTGRAPTSGGAEYAFDAGAKLKLGAEIAVYAGDEAQPREIFHGTITAVRGEYATGSPPEMTVLAEDALQRARMGRRSQAPRDKSPADVARAIAGDLGLTPVIARLDTPVGTWAQLNESDLAFLRRLLGALRRRSADRRHRAARLAARRRASRRASSCELDSQLAARASAPISPTR